MKKILLAAVAATLALSACTDTQRSNLTSFGDSRTITCYSGGVEIYKGRSTGMPEVVETVVQFRDTNGNFQEIIADCVLTSN